MGRTFRRWHIKPPSKNWRQLHVDCIFTQNTWTRREDLGRRATTFFACVKGNNSPQHHRRDPDLHPPGTPSRVLLSRLERLLLIVSSCFRLNQGFNPSCSFVVVIKTLICSLDVVTQTVLVALQWKSSQPRQRRWINVGWLWLTMASGDVAIRPSYRCFFCFTL